MTSATLRNAAREVRVALPKITLAMMICGIVGAAGIGAASAANATTVGEDGTPAVTVKYDASSLTTDRGARQLYQRLVSAAEQVCPQLVDNPGWITAQVRQCREQSIARAVLKINNPKLVAVYNSSIKNG